MAAVRRRDAQATRQGFDSRPSNSVARGTWTGVPTATRLQWERCDAGGGGCAAIDGATGSSYEVSAADTVHTLRVVETATNAGGDGTAASATTALVPLQLAPITTPTPDTPPVVTPTMTKALLRKALLPRPARGRRILRKGKKVKVLAKAKFTPLGGKTVTVSKRLIVKR